MALRRDGSWVFRSRDEETGEAPAHRSFVIGSTADRRCSAFIDEGKLPNARLGAEGTFVTLRLAQPSESQPPGPLRTGVNLQTNISYFLTATSIILPRLAMTGKDRRFRWADPDEACESRSTPENFLLGTRQEASRARC